MPISPTTGPGSGLPPMGAPDRPDSPKEAAKAFEKVLVGQFVEVMTKNMFSSSMAGEKGPGWMSSQRDTQRDMFTEMLSSRLVESDALQLSDRLVRQWEDSGLSSPPPSND